MYRMTGDFARLLESAAKGKLDASLVGWTPGATACVVLASAGYPGAYHTGIPITGIPAADSASSKVFQAGTLLHEGKLVTSGGRVLGVTAGGATLQEAIDRAYGAVEKIHFEGMHFRRDIGQKGLRRSG
jgi:phosphoribosylamine--glycine ligase